jgi:hypothetical protein
MIFQRIDVAALAWRRCAQALLAARGQNAQDARAATEAKIIVL